MGRARLIAMLLIAGCTAQDADPGVDVSRAGLQSLSFTTVFDPSGVGELERESRRVITSAEQYARIFGHAAPADVHFNDGEIVVLYDAGVKRTSGYLATIQQMGFANGTLYVTTRLDSPSESCVVVQSVTHPYMLVKLQRPWLLFRARFEREDLVRNCNGCWNFKCPAEHHCEVSPVACIHAPCLATALCVSDEPPPVSCGGLLGIPCQGSGKCEDDPSDDCDPENGGSDCIGICHCIQNVLCRQGYVFNHSPDVCACVPDRDPCASVRCKAGTHCEPDSGNCVPDAASCGGIASIKCPGAGSCVDNPKDNCDPKRGNSDCPGLCQCNALAFCTLGYVWDSSPDVCNCVKATNPCTIARCKSGTSCKVIDGAAFCVSDGTLACGLNTCSKGNVCCNASCGVCTVPGMFCTKRACPPPS